VWLISVPLRYVTKENNFYKENFVTQKKIVLLNLKIKIMQSLKLKIIQKFSFFICVAVLNWVNVSFHTWKSKYEI